MPSTRKAELIALPFSAEDRYQPWVNPWVRISIASKSQDLHTNLHSCTVLVSASFKMRTQALVEAACIFFHLGVAADVFLSLPQQRNMSSSRYRMLRDESLRLVHRQVPDVIILQRIVQDETQSITQICWQVNPHSTNDLCSLLGISGRTLSDFFSKCRKAGLLTWVPERGQYVHRCWTLTVMPGKACCPPPLLIYFFKKNLDDAAERAFHPQRAAPPPVQSQQQLAQPPNTLVNYPTAPTSVLSYGLPTDASSAPSTVVPIGSADDFLTPTDEMSGDLNLEWFAQDFPQAVDPTLVPASTTNPTTDPLKVTTTQINKH